MSTSLIELYYSLATSYSMKSGSFASDLVTAHAMAGQRHPVAYSINHLIVYPSEGTLRDALRVLGSLLVRKSVCDAHDARNLAEQAIRSWWDDNCDHCTGRGVMTFLQDPCPECRGSGKKDLPQNQKVKIGVFIIRSEMQNIEYAMKEKLRRR